MQALLLPAWKRPLKRLPVYSLPVLLAIGFFVSTPALGAPAGSSSKPPAPKKIATAKNQPVDPLAAMVTKANKAAAAKDYPTAIRLYEQATAKLPGDSMLKRNLSILYANYGVELQENSQYEAALKAFDQSLAMTPPQSTDAQTVREAKAGAYYGQAMDLRNRSQAAAEAAQTGSLNASATPASGASGREDYVRIRGILQKALAIRPEQAVFKQGMASVYLDEAYELATQEKYAESVPLLQKAMAYDKTNPAIKESLANVYLGLARNDVPNRKAWIDKAKATDNSEHIRATAEKIMMSSVEPIKPTANGQPQNSQPPEKGMLQKIKGFANPASESTLQAPKDINKLSVREMIQVMENQLGLQTDPAATLLQRLEKIEKPVLGEVGTGAMAVRTKTAYTLLMGTSKSTSSSPSQSAANSASPGMDMSAPMSQVPENTYLDRVLANTDGKIVRWGRFPLRVYIDTPKLVEKAEKEQKAEREKAEKQQTEKGKKAEIAAKANEKQAGSAPSSSKQQDSANAKSVATVEMPELAPLKPSGTPALTRPETDRVGTKAPSAEAAEDQAVARLYSVDYRQAVMDGFRVWTDATGGFTQIIEVKNPAAADIQVNWSSKPYLDRFADSASQDKLADVFRNYIPPRRSNMMKALQVASMATPSYFSLIPQSINASMQYKEAKKLQVLIDESKIVMGLSGLDALNPEAARLRVQNMAAREAGHVLGLKCNSPDASDLLHAGELSSVAVQAPSQRDLNTLRALYDRPANIVLNVR